MEHSWKQTMYLCKKETLIHFQKQLDPLSVWGVNSLEVNVWSIGDREEPVHKSSLWKTVLSDVSSVLSKKEIHMYIWAVKYELHNFSDST